MVHGPGPWTGSMGWSMVVHGPGPWGGPWTPVHVLYTSEEIKVVEFHSPNPKFFRCGNTFNLEVVSLLNII